jgi:hypothetical protein
MQQEWPELVADPQAAVAHPNQRFRIQVRAGQEPARVRSAHQSEWQVPARVAEENRALRRDCGPLNGELDQRQQAFARVLRGAVAVVQQGQEALRSQLDHRADPLEPLG